LTNPYSNNVTKFPGGSGAPVTIGRGFDRPNGVFVTATGDVYVSDYGNSAIKLVPGGTGTPVIIAGQNPGMVYYPTSVWTNC
jgi:hypothetical protein